MKEIHPCYTGKLFRTGGQSYFFNTLAGSIDAVSDNTACVISRYSNMFEGCDVPRADFASEDLRPIIKNPYSNTHIENTLDRKLRLLVMELTSFCNMSCTYCIDGEAYNQKNCLGPANMSEDLALRGVDYLVEHSTDQTHPLAISFYGGEPLLRFPILKKVVEYAKKKANEKNKDVVFSLTTNGTLLTPYIATFLIRNSVQLAISLDGPAKIHDRYRHFKKDGNTHKIVVSALRMVQELDPNYFDRLVRCSVVVTPGSNLEELQAYFTSLNINIIANFVDTYGINENILRSMPPNTGLSTLKARIALRLEEEGSGFLTENGRNKDFASQLLSPLIRRFLMSDRSSKNMSLGQCVLGASRLYLSADGYFYPCEKVAGHSLARIGNIESGIQSDKVIDLINKFYDMSGKRCSGCWMSSRCSACFALACSGDRLSIEKYDHYCRGTMNWGEAALKVVVSTKREDFG
jgi:uncharacterized protein